MAAGNIVTIGPVRFSYLHVFEKVEALNGDMIYQSVIMVPKSSKAVLKKCNEGIQAAIKIGIKKKTITAKETGALDLPLRDGDDDGDRGNKGKEFLGHVFINAKNKFNQPGCIDENKNEVVDEEEFYSGMWGYANLSFYTYNRKGNKGVGVGLNHVMKTKDDDRLDGRISTDEAFEDIEPPTPEAGGEELE